MIDMPNARSGGVKSLVTGRTNHSSLENGRFWFRDLGLRYFLLI